MPFLAALLWLKAVLVQASEPELFSVFNMYTIKHAPMVTSEGYVSGYLTAAAGQGVLN